MRARSARAGRLAMRAMSNDAATAAVDATPRGQCERYSDETYAKMRDDEARTAAYDRAIALHSKGRTVLDIGTGTGLLAMMAARAGAGRVTACEASPPMVAVARTVLQANGFVIDGDSHGNSSNSVIHLVQKRSTDMSVDLDMSGLPADIVVSEVLGTNLLGEGMLSTVRHAVAHLATPDAIIIPARARIHAQIMDSKLVRAWHLRCALNHSGSAAGSKDSLFALLLQIVLFVFNCAQPTCAQPTVLYNCPGTGS